MQGIWIKTIAFEILVEKKSLLKNIAKPMIASQSDIDTPCARRAIIDFKITFPDDDDGDGDGDKYVSCKELKRPTELQNAI